MWTTDRTLTSLLFVLTLVYGVLPAGVAHVGRLIVDQVVFHVRHPDDGQGWWETPVLPFIATEAALILTLSGCERGLNVVQTLFRALLGQRVNVMILEKAMSLRLAHFEDSEFYDKLVRAQREASIRPLSLVMRLVGFLQNTVTILSFSILLWRFSSIAVFALLLSGVPLFVSEARFSGEAFRLFRWRSPERRRQVYLETVISREDYVKETKLFQLAPKLLGRYKHLFAKLYREDHELTMRRSRWGFFLETVGTLALYGVYLWVARSALLKHISIGDMTMYFLIFKQGQSAVNNTLMSVGGMYEDNLYLSNLYEYLDQPVAPMTGTATAGRDPADGIRFENVTFHYPNTTTPAVQDLSFQIRPGQTLALVGANGSGKTTLIKLLTRLYEPDSGKIYFQGTEIRDWNFDALCARIGVIFQDFVHYQFTVGENIGAGDVQRFDDEQAWQRAAIKGMADPFVRSMPEGYHTHLGKWFEQGVELSGGQWQKVALSRAFMRENADLLVLDEPTSAIDAESEAQLFAHFQTLTQHQMAIVISHRFSTVRQADVIVVLQQGRAVEIGSHDTLMSQRGLYARLFALQAKGYQ